MGKVTIEDSCFVPRKTVWVEYSGPDPFAFFREFKSILRSVFEVGSSSIGEPRWMWDWTGDPIQLYVHWLTKRSASRWSTMWFSIRTVGFISKAKKEGTFRMEVEPVVRHIFKGNRIVMWFWWLYWYLFYNKFRQATIVRCKAMADRFIAIIKEMYNLGSVTED